MRRLLIGFWMLFGIDLSVANILVFQSGDTLKFCKDDSPIDKWILKSGQNESGGYYNEKAKVSPDNKRFFIYKEQYFNSDDSIKTQLILYNAHKTVLGRFRGEDDRKISFELSRILEDRLILFTTNYYNQSPKMEIIQFNKAKRTIDLNQWNSIIDYQISQNRRYVIFHGRKPYNTKLWDYIYFIDLQTNKVWEYLFPICFSCKRGRIVLKVYDDGGSEAIYKNEHRIFDRNGNLVDVFVKMD
uniref:Uncharacterized protein n=1 Tax=candidate division WOR-3 bacterium TaxID=2052148 RepID=A0A7V0Z4L2_UNCW3